MAELRSPSYSAVETRYILAPHQVNSLGSAFGGVVMSWIDMVGAMAAQRHCGGVVVTASIDNISFKAPIYVGDHVILKACVNYVGSTSMEVGVRVSKENPSTGEQTQTAVAYLTFVHVDEKGLPKKVPGLSPESREEKRRCEEAELRVRARKELLEKTRKE
jgi:acyl-CoA hydrolase